MAHCCVHRHFWAHPQARIVCLCAIMSEAALRQEIPEHVTKDLPTYSILSQLREIHKHLGECTDTKSHSDEDLRHFREELSAIDEERAAHSGIFGGRIDHDDPSKTVIPAGQADCSDELAACYTILEKLKDSAQPMSSSAQDILYQLQGIKRFLEDAVKSQGSVSLDELQRHGGMLDKIDADRLAHGGIFAGDLKEGVIPRGQAVLSSLLAHNYQLLDRLKRAKEA